MVGLIFDDNSTRIQEISFNLRIFQINHVSPEF